MTLPRDYMASFAGKHFTYNTLNEEEVNFITSHRNAFELVSEFRPNYSDRRLKSQAIPFAIFLLVELDVRESNDEEIFALFVEVFGDKTQFFNVCLKEIEKAEIIIEAHSEQLNRRDSQVIEDDDMAPNV